MKTNNLIVGIIEKKHILSLLSNDKRLDGREIMEPRLMSVETEVLNKANGSAKVTLGNTIVYAGVKTELGTPFPDTPDKGVLIVNIELTPVASPFFESGPPRANAIEMARVCDRAIRESKVIEVEKLCVIPSEKVWIIFIDIYAVSDDGNLLDAASLAAMAALATTKLPVTQILDTETKEVEISKEETIPLPINTWSTTITFSKLGEKFIVDPTLDEEKVEILRFTVGLTEESYVTAIQKSLASGLSQNQAFNLIDKAMELGLQRIEELKEKILK
ncbi:MAG: exosome complex protein Rrp42 [Candidatus Hodarchaeales archaeon]|jgi:exosome complex component RRP42